MPIDTLKIDVSFGCKLGQKNDSEVAAQATIALGRVLNLEMLAEGVESEQAQASLRG